MGHYESGRSMVSVRLIPFHGHPRFGVALLEDAMQSVFSVLSPLHANRCHS
jgi:hypothetical protein